jgi:hypothetical protein
MAIANDPAKNPQLEVIYCAKDLDTALTVTAYGVNEYLKNSPGASPDRTSLREAIAVYS